MSYQFDTTRGLFRVGQHDFATDLQEAAGGNHAAESRALAFVQKQFAVTTTSIPGGVGTAQSTVTTEQRDYIDPPVWSAANKGPIANGQPFPIPVLAPVSSLAGAHTEGVEPPVTFAAARGNVTPKPISGKVEVTREAWDLKGPQASTVIWGRMVAAYYEALEASAVAALNAAAATITDVTLTTGAADVTLVDQMLDAVAAFAFVPGGSQNARAILQTDLYRGLAKAKDSTGRKLLTGRGPANSDQPGQSLDLQGVPGLPGWALGATSTASSNSWLLDPRAVHGWATPPQRLDFQYRVAFVDVAVWGYSAVIVNDPTGVRQVTYDPVV